MGAFDGIGDLASGAFESISSTVSGAASTVSSAFDGWFGGREAAPAPSPAASPAGPSLWDRIGLTFDDFGRGLSEEGVGGLLHPSEMVDRQEAKRTLAAQPAAARSPAESSNAPPQPEPHDSLRDLPLGPADPRIGGRVPALDQTAAAGWRKGTDGKWLGAGDASAARPQLFGLADGRYHNENESYFQGGADRTKYYDENERDAHRLRAAGGKLVGADGAALDTEGASSALTEGAAHGSHLFAADAAGAYATDSVAENTAQQARRQTGGTVEAIHHSSMVDGADVRSAGEISAHDGWLKMISNNSGHYRPGAMGNVQAVDALDAMGVNTDAAIVHHKAVEAGDRETHDFYNARAFAASRGNVDLLDTHKAMFRDIHSAAQDMRSGPDPEEPVGDVTPGELRSRAYRAEAKAQDGERYAAENQEAPSSGFRNDGVRPSAIDARGEALSGWAGGSYDAAARLGQDHDIRSSEPQRQAKLAEKKRAAAAAAAAESGKSAAPAPGPGTTGNAPVAGPVQVPAAAPGAHYLQPGTLAASAAAPAKHYLQPGTLAASAAAPAEHYLQPGTLAASAAAPAEHYLQPGTLAASAAAPAEHYLQPGTLAASAAAPAEHYLQPGTLAASAAAPAEHYLQPGTLAASAAAPAEHYLQPGTLTAPAAAEPAPVAPSAPAQQQAAPEPPSVFPFADDHDDAESEEAQTDTRSAARERGDLLGRHDQLDSVSRTGALKNGWRKQVGAAAWARSGDGESAMWRRESGSDEAAPEEQLARFQRDPRKTQHYDHEFENYIPGAREPMPRGIDQRTKRYDNAELAAHEVSVQNGLLTRADGTTMDTSASAATKMAGTDRGRNIFALDGYDVHSANGVEHRQSLYAADVAKEHAESKAGALAANAGGANGTLEHVHHSSFTGGADVDGAGDLAVREGFVQRISNTSGHYEPHAQSNYQAVKALDRMGANLDATVVENKTPTAMNGELETETFRAHGMLASGNNLPLLRTHQRAFEMIRGGARPAKQAAPAATTSPYDGD